ncbi:EthD family reductase [Roseibium sp. Sym1]|uniref:EthD family reductase n=1 Tax=Roseibium sp. Sym1 TaxID=3016006 RepID=UPI0022B35322|nr:EthD family reductase [Roseibium sp. Sym1]
MAITLQVLYPITPDTTFDHDYYKSTHMPLVSEHMGPFLLMVQASRGLAGGPDAPPDYYAIATMVFESQEKLSLALEAAGPVLADIPNYTNTRPQMLVGEVIS